MYNKLDVNALNVGDKLIKQYTRGNSWQVVTVERETKTQLVLSDAAKLNKKTGCLVGSRGIYGSFDSQPYYVPHTEEMELRLANRAEMLRACSALSKLGDNLRQQAMVGYRDDPNREKILETVSEINLLAEKLR